MNAYTKLCKQLVVSITTAVVLSLLYVSLAAAQIPTTGTVNRNANLRGGPGTTYPVVGSAQLGQAVTIVETNATGDWYRLASDQWIAAFLVNVAYAKLAPTPTETAPANSPVAVATPLSAASETTANRNANLRAGPGTNFAIIGTVRTGQALTLTGQNAGGGWYQIEGGAWIAAFLVNGATVPQPTALPTASTPSPVAATAAPSTDSGNQYVLVQKRLLDPYENGGSLDGPSVHCGYGRRLIVNVLDGNGNRVNGVAVQVQYGAREIVVTGAQGRGDGVAEFVLGSGQDVAVIQDASGAVTSEIATGLSTNPQNIPFDILQSARYCQDEATCRHFAETNSCNGHFSWNVTFQRTGS